jgi:hypothetical protein
LFFTKSVTKLGDLTVTELVIFVVGFFIRDFFVKIRLFNIVTIPKPFYFRAVY